MRLSRFLQVLYVVFFALPRLLHAQPEPLDWGKIPEFHLKMDSYPADTNAHAVILGDYGTVEFQQDWSMIYEFHRRVKILSEKGYEWGNVSLPYYSADNAFQVRNIKGQTFSIGPDGKTVRTVMEKSAIFDEKMDRDHKKVKFTLPALKPGAVFEYRYTIIIKSPVFIPEWEFQYEEPVFWSEYRVDLPPTLAYVRATIGDELFEIDEIKEGARTDGVHKLVRLVMRDLPALREEPFMTTPNDYRARVRFQLSEYKDGNTVKPFLESWTALAKRLMEMDEFGKRLGRGKSIRRQVEETTAGKTTPLDKMKALYDFVRNSIEWTDRGGILMDQELDDVLAKRKGTSTEMNLLFTSLLREAGIEAHPVLISTRTNGRIIEVYPILDQFDALLTYAKIDGKDYIMSPTNRFRPYTVLPVDALNGKGWLVSETGQRWIPITAAAKFQHQSTLAAQIDESGTLTGSFESSDGQYSAVFKRDHLSEETDRNKFFTDAFFDETQEVTLDSLEVVNEKETDVALKTKCRFSIPNYAQMAGDFIYLNPIVTTQLTENPLKLPERKFPVDMAYPSDIVYNLAFSIPEGYEVQELPRDMKATIRSGKAVYQRKVQAEQNVIRVQSRLLFSDAVYPVTIYQDLKEFYNHVIATQAEQIVLKRKAEVPETVGGNP